LADARINDRWRYNEKARKDRHEKESERTYYKNTTHEKDIGKRANREYVAKTSRDLGMRFGAPKAKGYRQPFCIIGETTVGYHQPSADAREIISTQGPLMIAGTLSPYQEARLVRLLSKNLDLFTWADQEGQVMRPQTGENKRKKETPQRWVEKNKKEKEATQKEITKEAEVHLGHDFKTPNGEHMPKQKELHYCTRLGNVKLPCFYETSSNEERDKKQEDLRVLRTDYPASEKTEAGLSGSK
jgi:hypothetical protein